MGQPVSVTVKPTRDPGVWRFELNRSLTGMGHEHYLRGQEITGDRPADELARRLFAFGGVDGVHVFSNQVTVDLAKGGRADDLVDTIRQLYIHYTPGVQPSIV